MKILLQHARTQLYFRGLGDWTANPFEAFSTFNIPKRQLISPRNIA